MQRQGDCPGLGPACGLSVHRCRQSHAIPERAVTATTRDAPVVDPAGQRARELGFLGWLVGVVAGLLPKVLGVRLPTGLIGAALLP